MNWAKSEHMGIHFLPIAGLQKESVRSEAASSSIEGYVLATICWLFSAGVYIAVKAVAKEMPPWTLCFWRVFLACLILLPTTRRHWPAISALIRKSWFFLIVIGGLGFAITQGLMYTALNYTTAINAGLILALMPLITMVLARFVLNEPLGGQQIVGAVIACFGMAVIVVRGDLPALMRLDLNTGELLVILGAICFALYTVLLRKAKFDLPRLPLLVVLLAGGAISALPFYIWELVHHDRTNLNTQGLIALAYVAGPGGALMYYLFNRSVEALGATKAGTFLYLQTVFIAILAYFFLGERLQLYHLIGAAFIVVGVLFVTLSKAR